MPEKKWLLLLSEVLHYKAFYGDSLEFKTEESTLRFLIYLENQKV